MKYTSAWIIKDTRATSEPFPKQRRSTARAASRSRSGNTRVAPKWIVVFALIISTILLLANAFVCATWSRFSGLQGWRVWQIIPGSLALAFIPASILGMSYSNPALRIVYAVSASWLGALNFALWAAASCWIVDATAQLFGWPLARYDLAAALFGAAFLATGYGILNAAWLRVTRVTVQLPNLPQAWQGRTLALVTDLHLGHLSGPGFLRRVISKLRAAQPDAVLISGDMFDGTTAGLDRLVAPWRDFAPGRKIFYVTGNHDEFADRNLYLDAVKRTGIRVLNNEMVSVCGLQIVGVHDSEAADPAALRQILRQAQIDRLHASILLAHKPTNPAVAEEEGVSLQVSGHTHAGQFWPWNLLVSRIYGQFAYGLSRFGQLMVYTSSGAGTWGPPLRVGTKSEIVLIRLQSKVRGDAAEQLGIGKPSLQRGLSDELRP